MAAHFSPNITNYNQKTGKWASRDRRSVLVSQLQLIETRCTIHATNTDVENTEPVLKGLESGSSDQDLLAWRDSEFHLQLVRCSRNALNVRIYRRLTIVRLHAQRHRMKRGSF